MDYVFAILTIVGIPAMFIGPLVLLAYTLRCQEPGCTMLRCRSNSDRV